MMTRLLATTAVILTVSAPAIAQQAEPPAEVAADPEPTASTTGGVTATGREILPDDTTDAPVSPETLDAAAGGASARPAAAPAKAISPEMVESLRQMALEQQKIAAATTLPDEAAQAAEQKALAAHRESLFARMADRP